MEIVIFYTCFSKKNIYRQHIVINNIEIPINFEFILDAQYREILYLLCELNAQSNVLNYNKI